MFEIFAKIAEQWTAVMQNPAALVPAFFVGFVAGWGVAWLILRQRLQHSRDVIGDLRAKLGEHTPAAEAEAAQKRELRERLGEFLVEGHELMNLCHKIDQPAPAEAATKWNERVRAFLAEKFDKSYVARFSDWSDLPLPMGSIKSPEHADLWSGIRPRCARLQQFINSLDR